MAIARMAVAPSGGEGGLLGVEGIHIHLMHVFDFGYAGLHPLGVELFPLTSLSEQRQVFRGKLVGVSP